MRRALFVAVLLLAACAAPAPPQPSLVGVWRVDGNPKPQHTLPTITGFTFKQDGTVTMYRWAPIVDAVPLFNRPQIVPTKELTMPGTWDLIEDGKKVRITQGGSATDAGVSFKGDDHLYLAMPDSTLLGTIVLTRQK
jgi:hypothetical protein